MMMMGGDEYMYSFILSDWLAILLYIITAGKAPAVKSQSFFA